jgi:hypothetical protein
MTLTKAKARANKTFIVQASLTIVTYNCQNIFIVHGTDGDILMPTKTLVMPKVFTLGDASITLDPEAVFLIVCDPFMNEL